MTHKTKGIVLSSVKYGDTSLIVHVYTELFGMQSYIMNGVRTASKKGHGKANLFQPGSILDLLVYHNELKNLQRIREFKWSFLYKSLQFDVIKNSVMLFMVELVSKTIKQPESNEELYHFIEDALIHLDAANAMVTANYPLYFSLQLPSFFGFQVSDDYSVYNNILDLAEGQFVHERPLHSAYLEGLPSQLTSELLKARHPEDLIDIHIHREERRKLLQAYQLYYSLHIQDFGQMKTLPVLEAVLS